MLDDSLFLAKIARLSVTFDLSTSDRGIDKGLLFRLVASWPVGGNIDCESVVDRIGRPRSVKYEESRIG